MQKVVIASKNPVKINCTKEGFEKIFPDSSFEYEGVTVPSDVSDQPMTDEETLQGAINRAKNGQQHSPDAHFWVGIEGGIDEVEDGMIAFAWVAVVSADKIGKSRTSTFYLPPKVVQLIHEGIELGYANDQVFGENNSKHKGGAVGSLTGGVLGRTEYYVQAVMLSLVPFRNPEIY